MNRTYFIRLTKNSSVDFGTGHYYIDHLGEGGVGVGVGRKILFVSQYHLPVSPPPSHKALEHSYDSPVVRS